MRNQKQIQKVLNDIYKYVTFAEIYEMASHCESLILTKNKIVSYNSTEEDGLNLTYVQDKTISHIKLTDKQFNHLNDLINENLNKTKIYHTDMIKYSDLQVYEDWVKYDFNTKNIEEIKDLLFRINTYCRGLSDLIKEVSVKFQNYTSSMKVTNTEGRQAKYKTRSFGIIVSFKVEKNGQILEDHESFSYKTGYESLNEQEIYNKCDEMISIMIKKFDAIPFKGGKYPVIISSGIGGVLFHEACGHALEYCNIMYNSSVFTDKLNQKIASEQVTLIDDPTIPKLTGSYKIDDNGYDSEKRILIENGILKSYLVDKISSVLTGIEQNGAGRRQSYLYNSTSRMGNTYLAAGTDKLDDMFKSINYGIFVKKISAGVVNPITGQFTFHADEVYLIEAGRITTMLKELDLLGSCTQLLLDVEMVSDKVEYQSAFCGAESGFIPVTVGQPYVKVKEILIGGSNE